VQGFSHYVDRDLTRKQISQKINQNSSSQLKARWDDGFFFHAKVLDKIRAELFKQKQGGSAALDPPYRRYKI